MKHLSDNEIQTCLEGGPSDKPSPIEEHLNDCADCQKRISLYRKIGALTIAALSNSIPDAFEKTFMEQLRDRQRQRRVSDVLVIMIASAGFIVIGTIIFLTPQLRQLMTDCFSDIWRYGTEVIAASDGSFDAVTVLLFAIFLFSLFAAVDRLAAAGLRSKTMVKT